MNEEITFDRAKLDAIVAAYKKDLPEHWGGEKYKWEAVRHFQEHWDIDAKHFGGDFAKMFEEATSKTYNLLSSYNYNPKYMIEEQFGRLFPAETQNMFRALFDQTQPLDQRITGFRSLSKELLARYKGDEPANAKLGDYQDERAISTYLWLMYPDSYYIYKFKELNRLCDVIGCNCSPKKGGGTQNIILCYGLFDRIRTILHQDDNLKSILSSLMDDTCYADPQMNTCIVDLTYFANRNYLPLPPEDYGGGDELDSYAESDFLDEVFMTENDLHALHGLLKNRQNVILQGAPGVGKTYAARRLAWAMMEEKDDSRIGFVQFHQSYSYEDFVWGYKPNGDGGFDPKTGIFPDFCTRAGNDPDRPYFFIIDEINRGNLSKIFGELLMLIEKDKRKEKGKRCAYEVMLPGGIPFSVPDNVYIIGTMNTADRSLALIDYALRRRFAFFPMQPGFDSKGFKKLQDAIGKNVFNKLIDQIKALNDAILSDDSLGEGFRIGHSHFCMEPSEFSPERIKSVVEYDIIPALKEYWFDDPAKADGWAKELRNVFPGMAAAPITPEPAKGTEPSQETPQ